MVQILVSQQPTTALNDCHLPRPRAATPPAFVLTPAPPQSGLPPSQPTALHPHPGLQTLDLDDEHVVAFVPSLSKVAVLNRTALALIGRLPLREPAAAAAFAGPLEALRELGLLTAAHDGALPPPPPAPILAAWLHVTNACNLRCTYCYIDKSAETMSEATARRAIDTVMEAAHTHGYSEVALKYAGGEPLLALDTVALMHSYARERAAAHRLGLQATVLSNGTALTPARIARLHELGVDLTISLDALDATNDRQRPTRRGYGSTGAVLAGIERAVAGGLAPTVALTVTGASIGSAPPLVAWLLERGLRFTVSFYREHACGGHHADLALDEARLIAGMRALYAEVERNPPPWSLLGALLDRADLSHAHGRACAAGEHYMVIDQHGRIAQCQMTLGRPVATLDDADPLLLIRLDQRLPLGRHVDEKEGCRTCEWRYWCGGGCPIATYRATGRTDVRSPNCAIYKALYPALLRLEGRRMLMQHAKGRTPLC